MPLDLYTHFTASQALSRLAPRHKSQMAVAFIGKPLFNFGNIHFHNTDDLKDRLLASVKKARLAQDDVRTVISPTFAAVSCTNKDVFAKLMGVIHDAPHLTEKNMTVQVTHQSAEWHRCAMVEFINDANDYLLKGNSPIIEVVQFSPNRRDYVFPTQSTMRKFCHFIETKLPPDVKPVELPVRLG